MGDSSRNLTGGTNFDLSLQFWHWTSTPPRVNFTRGGVDLTTVQELVGTRKCWSYCTTRDSEDTVTVTHICMTSLPSQTAGDNLYTNIKSLGFSRRSDSSGIPYSL